METGKANNIKASTFNIELFEQYHLSVQIGLNHISYCIINIITNNVEVIKKFDLIDDLTKSINADEILKLNFASSTVIFTDISCNLVPNELFTKESAKEIIRLNSEVYDIIKSDKLTAIDAHLVYTITSDISNIVYTFFPNATHKGQQSILIEQFSNFDNKEDHAYLYLSDNILNISAFKNSKFIFNNSFHFDTKEDILYYTLFTFEQLKLDLESVNVCLYGEITRGDENHQLLYDYIRNIDFGSRPNNLRLSSQFKEIKDHQYNVLFDQK